MLLGPFIALNGRVVHDESFSKVSKWLWTGGGGVGLPESARRARAAQGSVCQGVCVSTAFTPLREESAVLATQA